MTAGVDEERGITLRVRTGGEENGVVSGATWDIPRELPLQPVLTSMISMKMAMASATSRPCALEEFGLLTRVSLG